MTDADSRLPGLTEDQLDDAQRAVLEAIQASPRGSQGLVGPFGLWVRAPRIGQPAQALGAAVRFASTLPANVREVAICTVGAHFHAKFEFAAHAPLARAAGVPAAVVEAIRVGAEPPFEEGGEALAYTVARQLLRNHRLDDTTYRRVIETFGVEQTVELVTAVGFYCLVSLSLNAFEVALADGMTDPFPDRPG